jgi:hypothetical protein
MDPCDIGEGERYFGWEAPAKWIAASYGRGTPKPVASRPQYRMSVPAKRFLRQLLIEPSDPHPSDRLHFCRRRMLVEEHAQRLAREPQHARVVDRE